MGHRAAAAATAASQYEGSIPRTSRRWSVALCSEIGVRVSAGRGFRGVGNGCRRGGGGVRATGAEAVVGSGVTPVLSKRDEASCFSNEAAGVGMVSPQEFGSAVVHRRPLLPLVFL